MLWRVPLIQMVPLGARIWRHSLIHLRLKRCLSAAAGALSQSPLLTDTILPPWQVIPSLLRK